MDAAEAVVETKPAAASAALPETKLRLFKISSLARTPIERGSSGATALRIDTGIVADLPVRPCYGLANDGRKNQETHAPHAFPPHRPGRRRQPSGGRPDARRAPRRDGLEADTGRPHRRAGGTWRHHRHRGPPAGG